MAIKTIHFYLGLWKRVKLSKYLTIIVNNSFVLENSDTLLKGKAMPITYSYVCMFVIYSITVWSKSLTEILFDEIATRLHFKKYNEL